MLNEFMILPHSNYFFIADEESYVKQIQIEFI